MLTHPREQKILELLRARSYLRVAQISQELGVSEATVRRDLDRLQNSGQVRRMHGLVLPSQSAETEPPALHRMGENAIEKRCIGIAAARLIQDGDSVFIGSGTTAMEVARNLVGRKNLTVISNSLPVINLLAAEKNLNMVGIGGMIRHSEMSFIGHIAESALKEVRVDKVVLGIPAIDLRIGLTSDYLPEVVTDRAIISLGQTIILVADHTKFDRVASAFLAPIQQIHILVTDSLTPTDTLDQIRQMEIQVVIAA